MIAVQFVRIAPKAGAAIAIPAATARRFAVSAVNYVEAAPLNGAPIVAAVKTVQ